MRVHTILDMLGLRLLTRVDSVFLNQDLLPLVGDEGVDPVVGVLRLKDATEPLGSASDGFESVTFAYVQQISDAASKAEELAALEDGRTHGSVIVTGTAPFCEVERAFARLPQECAILSLKRSKLHAAFLHSYDVQQFAAKAQPVIGNPLIITNSDHRLLASAGAIPEDHTDVCEVVEHGYVPNSVKSGLDADGIIRDVRQRHHAVLCLDPRYGSHWVHSIMYVHHMEVGRFDVLENDRPITPLDLELIDYAGALAGVLVERMGASGSRVGAGSSVLRDLINGAFVNEQTMRSQLALTRLPAGESYAMFAVVGQTNADADYYTRLGRVVADTLRFCLWSVEGNVIAIMVPIGASSVVGYDDYARCKRVFAANRRLRSVLENNDLAVYVSEPFTQPAMAAGRFLQCIELMDALTGGTAAAQGGDSAQASRIHLFWEERFKVMASMAKTFDRMEVMIDKRVVAMRLYDQEHGTQYFDTAIMSVIHPGSPADAADALNVHRNTYFYRVNKVKEMFYIDLKDGDDRLNLAFTAQVLEGLGNRFHINLRDYPEE